MLREQISQRSLLPRSLSLICILLVLFVAVIQANHAHARKAKLSAHECSLCSVVHTGVLIKAAYQPMPTFVRSGLAPAAKTSSKLFLLVSSLYIRPPPSF